MIAPVPPRLSDFAGGERLGEAQGTIALDGKRLWLYPKEIAGRFTRSRNRFAWLLMLAYLGVPWLRFGGHAPLLLDWPDRSLVLFGTNYWAQDIPRFVPLVFAFILLVFLATARYGRLWCGWACPQTVFLQFAFAPLERWIEGKASQRRQRDAHPWTADWLWRKLAKHAAFVLIATWIGMTALAYFRGSSNLIHALLHPVPENYPGIALALLFAAAFYGNFAFFREQACILVCPYARFQSVLPDENTSLIAYDAKRGERRGKGARGSREGLGDCTDCRQCVLVCPTGIDIRQGQQLECIGCARCIDACDRTMAAWKKPAGLIRYATLGELEGKPKRGRPWRVIVYGLLAFAMASASAYLIAARPSVGIDPVRTGSAPYLRVGADSVLNTFALHLRNNGSAPRRVALEAEDGSALATNWDGQSFELAPGRTESIPLVVFARAGMFKRGEADARFALKWGNTRVTFRIELAGPWGKENP